MKTDDCLFSPANSMEELSGISSLATCLISSFPACESRERSSWESYSITSLGQRDRDQRLGTDSLRPVFCPGTVTEGQDLKLCLMREALHLVLT